MNALSPKYNLADHVHRALAILIALTMFMIPLVPSVFASRSRNALGATGIIRAAGTVTVDGIEVTSGHTIFPRCHVVTLGESESIIDLGNLTRLRLLAETDFMLDFSRANISATLAEGSVRGFIPAGIPVSISTAGAELITDPGQPVEFLIQVAGDDARVSVAKGRVDLRTGTTVNTVVAGDVFSTTAGRQDPADKDEEGLTTRQKVGLLAALGGAAAILVIIFRGRDPEEPELEFGGCVIVPSGDSPTICP